MKATEAFQILEILTRELMEKCDDLRRERDEARKAYDEARGLHRDLIMQVERKFPDESCHETARRYIRQAERMDNEPEDARVPPNA